ncbi:alkaline phosphatase [Ferrimonas gelatinilytica]|uniref:Alkaline phosphatase n=1 Tax=Ferrimonas gelatinilytica TaxID=1255257 RepID=A0ABP9RWT4_9GAMM
MGRRKAWLAGLMMMVLGAALPASARDEVRNVIFMIGDGMGPAYLTAYRYALAGEPGGAIAPTIFDQLLVGSASTYPMDDTFVTDSAAAATALATGVKSYNGAIGVDNNQVPLRSILEQARLLGKSTGVVTTSQVNHATPASFLANVKRRSLYDAIAEQYVHKRIADKTMLDLMFGGGERYFSRAPGGLALQLREMGWQQAWEMAELEQLERLPAMALMAEVALPHAIDSAHPDRLLRMTDKALALLSSQPNGFFLMVEGSQIDWCGHANDIRCALGEMADFAKAVERAKAFVEENPDTLLVITADHSTGGLTLGAGGTYQWLPGPILQVERTAGYIARKMLEAPESPVEAVWSRYASLPLSSQELAMLALARKAQLDGEGPYHLSSRIGQLVAKRSFTGWTTSGHTGEDVSVMAYGEGADTFIGFQDNADIARKIMSLLGEAQRP